MWPSKPTDEINFAFRASGVSILKIHFFRRVSTRSSRSIDTWSSRIERLRFASAFLGSRISTLNFLPSFAFSQSVAIGVHDLLTCVLLHIHGPQLLQVFDLSTRLDGLFHGNKSMVKFYPYTHPFIIQSDD
jgi:hypothetical protein